MATIHANTTDCGATARAQDATDARALGETNAATAHTIAKATTASATIVSTRKKLVATSTSGIRGFPPRQRTENGLVSTASLVWPSCTRTVICHFPEYGMS